MIVFVGVAAVLVQGFLGFYFIFFQVTLCLSIAGHIIWVRLKLFILYRGFLLIGVVIKMPLIGEDN